MIKNKPSRAALMVAALVLVFGIGMCSAKEPEVPYSPTGKADDLHLGLGTCFNHTSCDGQLRLGYQKGPWELGFLAVGETTADKYTTVTTTTTELYDPIHTHWHNGNHYGHLEEREIEEHVSYTKKVNSGFEAYSISYRVDFREGKYIQPFINFGVAYLDKAPSAVLGCNLQHMERVGVEFNKVFTIGVEHYSSAGRCKPNTGFDTAYIQFRFPL